MHEWQAGSAYLYILHLDRSALAWEYLRRNPEYQRQWHAGELTERHNLSSRWGCTIAEDPKLDGREAQPGWLPDPTETIRITASENSQSSDATFSVWNLRGRRRLSYTKEYLELDAVHATSYTRLRMDHSVADGIPYAYVVRADTALHERLDKVCQHAQRLKCAQAANQESNQPRINRTQLVHARTLQTLDGVQAGASHRDIAHALFGATDVTTRWSSDGELRAQVRYFVRRGRKLMKGGYRTLLTQRAS